MDVGREHILNSRVVFIQEGEGGIRVERRSGITINEGDSSTRTCIRISVAS